MELVRREIHNRDGSRGVEENVGGRLMAESGTRQRGHPRIICEKPTVRRGKNADVVPTKRSVAEVSDETRQPITWTLRQAKRVANWVTTLRGKTYEAELETLESWPWKAGRGKWIDRGRKHLVISSSETPMEVSRGGKGRVRPCA